MSKHARWPLFSFIQDELAKERSKVRELAGEGARRAIQERSAAEQRYNAHFDELEHDLAAQYDNVAKLQVGIYFPGDFTPKFKYPESSNLHSTSNLNCTTGVLS